MKAQWENLLMSSLMLYIDNKVCNNGQGFINHVGQFYKTKKQFNQYHSYSLPFKQIIADSSVPNANIMQGVYINGNFTSVGESGLEGILHHKGTLLFSEDHDADTITGNFAVKDFNVYITTKAEEDLLFKTAPQVNPKLAQASEGLDPNTEAYPAIFLKNMGGHDDPLGFGGMNDTVSYIRAIVLSDSAFNLDAVCGILKNSFSDDLPIVESLPFNALGAFTNVAYDYDSIVSQITRKAQIWRTTVSKVSPQRTLDPNVNLDVFAALIDFEIHAFMAN